MKYICALYLFGGRFWLLLLWVLPGFAGGQSYTAQYRMITPEDGLSSRFSRYILQDQEGVIWISTLEGLDRYDGQAFKSFVGEELAGAVLMLESTDGLLWISRYGRQRYKGVPGMRKVTCTIFDPREERPYTFSEYFGSRAPFGEQDIFGLRAGKEGAVYIGTKSGKAYLYKEGQFELILDNGGALPMPAPLPAADGSYWVRTVHSIVNMDGRGRMLARDTLPYVPDRIVRVNDSAFVVQAEAKVEINSSLLKFPGRPGFTRQYGKAGIGHFWDIQQGPDGSLWCLGDNDLVILNDGGDTIFSFRAFFPAKEEINFHFWETALFFDRSGLAWLVLPQNIMLLEVRENPFQVFLDGQQMSTRGILQLSPDEVLANTYKEARVVSLVDKTSIPIANTPFSYGIGACKAKDGTLWIATHSNTVARALPGMAEWRVFPSRKGPDSTAVLPLQPFIDSKGDVWVGTMAGLAFFHAGQQQLLFYDAVNCQHGLDDKHIRAIHENSEGLWLVTNDGLFLLSPNTEQVERIEGLPFEDLYHLYEESSDRFWMSTRGGGLIRWDRNRGHMEQFSKKDGLSSNFIYAAYPDAAGYLWLPSNNGLMRFDTASNRVVVFDKTHGLPAEEFNYTAHLQLEDGRLLFGGINGLVLLDTKDISIQTESHTSIKVLEFLQYDRSKGGMEERTAQMMASGQIELRKGSNFFSLRFVLQDYLEPEENRYAYTIEGLEEEWHELNDNLLRVGGLPYGRYLLRVRAMGHEGIWSEEELVIPLFSYAPVYLRWWFILLSAVLLSGMGIFLFQWRVKQLQRSKEQLEAEVARRTEQIEQDKKLIARQKARLEETNATKDKLFSILGHELRGPLMYFGNMAQRISRSVEENDYSELEQLGNKIRKVVKSSSDLLEQLLHWSLLQSGRLKFQPEIIEVEPVILRAMKPFNESAELKNIELQYEFEPGLEAWFDSQALTLVIRNLLSNAMKFSFDGGRIVLQTLQKEEWVAIEILDEGVGMTANQIKQIRNSYLHPTARGTSGERGMGLGLSIVMDILRMSGGEMKIKSEKGKGSVFTLLLPLQAV